MFCSEVLFIMYYCVLCNSKKTKLNVFQVHHSNSLDSLFSHHFKKAGRPTGHLSFLKWRRCQKLNILLQKLSQYCVQLTSDELRTFVLEKSHSDGACKDFPLHSLERKTGRWHLCMWCHFIRTTQTVCVRMTIMKDCGYNHADLCGSTKSWNLENPLCPWMNI